MKREALEPFHYLRWAQHRFLRQSKLSGLSVSAIITAILIFGLYASWQRSGMPVWALAAGILGCLLFTSFFFVLAVSFRTGLPVTPASPNQPSVEDFSKINFAYVTSDKFIRRLSAAQWRKIREFEDKSVPQHVPNEQHIESLERWKKRCAKTGFWGLILFIPVLILISTLYDHKMIFGWHRLPLLFILAAAYLATVLGYSGRTCCASLIGLFKREITLGSSWSRLTYSGAIAVWFGLWGAFLSLGFAGLFVFLFLVLAHFSRF